MVTELSALYLHDEEKKVTCHTFNTIKKKIIYQSSSLNDKLELFGSWNHWSSAGIMQRKGKIGYQLDIQLAPGKYEYKFKVNGQWTHDEKVAVNGNGNH